MGSLYDGLAVGVVAVRSLIGAARRHRLELPPGLAGHADAAGGTCGRGNVDYDTERVEGEDADVWVGC